MEAIYFYKQTVEIAFLENCASWPVPRAGEFIKVAKGEDRIEGTVARVAWYYSSGNRGPVVQVYIA